MTDIRHYGQKPSPYQFFILGLCVYALTVLAIESFGGVAPETRKVLMLSDLVVCLFFLADFIHSLILAPNRWKYFLTWGWIDLLSSVPAVGFLRWGRAGRIVRIFRVLRGIRATRMFAAFILERRAEGASLAAILVITLLVFIASMSILVFEAGTGSNIRTAEDALWWTLTTITTVGYGDRFPVTTEGRLVAMFLMIGGIGMFGTFSALVTHWFLSPRQVVNGNEIEALRREILSLHALIEQRLNPPLPGCPRPDSQTTLERENNPE
ncbi:MAG: ion transporter [Candidatus Hinthialibacteria bacterium]|nr:ion transporter [Candidatus Omnitrophica bacterium COP1]MCK6496104.1 ion transporter [bacterium]NUP93840.1 ion transporter [Candidatus Omnitrophota bacterium]